MSVARSQRAALCDLLLDLGPDAPTLCEGWTTAHLLAHLLVRERRPDAALGILVPALSSRTERVMAAVTASKPFPDLVEQLRNGPPMWSPWAIPVLGDRGNAAEYFVHHEDVRRAQPNWEPGPADDELESAMWSTLRLVGRMLYRRSPVGVRASIVGHDELVMRRGEPAVTLVGLASEIVLHAFGRDPELVRVVVQGEPDDRAAFEHVNLGF